MDLFLSKLSTFGNALPGDITQGLIWGILAIGVFITYKILVTTTAYHSTPYSGGSGMHYGLLRHIVYANNSQNRLIMWSKTLFFKTKA